MPLREVLTGSPENLTQPFGTDAKVSSAGGTLSFKAGSRQGKPDKLTQFLSVYCAWETPYGLVCHA